MNICVFGASSEAIDPKYIEAGERLGRSMESKGHSLVFGGGATGLMGAVVRGITEKGGTSIGVAPTFFDKPIGILNTGGYYDELIQMLIHTAEQGFMEMKCMDTLCVSDDPEELLAMVEQQKSL